MAFQDTFKALSDPVRREILFLLKDGRKSAGDIAANFDMTQATVSYHLSVLKKADLVQETRKANFIYYDLNTSVFEDLMLYFAQFKDAASDNTSQQGENEDGKK
ncbi:MAG: winged helix-turn-helix transcriptional regulator [Treponema sp.]|nr:winged helix-turn-helix transcriptional regulator [Candidatus Treponema caballi]